MRVVKVMQIPGLWTIIADISNLKSNRRCSANWKTRLRTIETHGSFGWRGLTRVDAAVVLHVMAQLEGLAAELALEGAVARVHGQMRDERWHVREALAAELAQHHVARLHGHEVHIQWMVVGWRQGGQVGGFGQRQGRQSTAQHGLAILEGLQGMRQDVARQFALVREPGPAVHAGKHSPVALPRAHVKWLLQPQKRTSTSFPYSRWHQRSDLTQYVLLELRLRYRLRNLDSVNIFNIKRLYLEVDAHFCLAESAGRCSEYRVLSVAPIGSVGRGAVQSGARGPPESRDAPRKTGHVICSVHAENMLSERSINENRNQIYMCKIYMNKTTMAKKTKVNFLTARHRKGTYV